MSGWDVSNVTTIAHIVRGCSSLEVLNVSGWDTSKVTTLASAFRNTDGLDTNDYKAVQYWDIGVLTDATNMLDACTNSLSTSDYNAVLTAWEGQPHQDNVTVHFNNAKHSGAGTIARAALVADGWTITDGVQNDTDKRIQIGME